MAKGKSARVKFAPPVSIKNEEARQFIKDAVKYLNDHNAIGPKDIPNLHRMATSYDMYLSADAWLSENQPFYINKKGEPVKHPYVNIGREAWNQYAATADKYGLTPKSRAQIDSHAPKEKQEETPLDRYFGDKCKNN